jgi:hypothetical protein
VAVLVAFAIAQPLFDLLSRYPEFFVARQSQPVDIVLLALALTFVPFLSALLLEVLFSLTGENTQKLLHGLLVAVLLTALVLQALKRIPGVSGPAIIAAAALLGVIIAVVYLRFSPLQTYCTWLWPTILVFPVLFLFVSPVYRILSSDTEGERPRFEVETDVPIVFVIFDELPLVSLLDEDQAIDAVRYPHFAELAAQSHWYRNATTVSDSTLVSIPAILTGRYPKLHDARLPTLDDYPLNLFTLLEGSHQLSVYENATQLSPTTQSDQAAVNRMRSLIVDLAVVYGHLVLPVELGSKLPPVARSWKNFVTAELSLDSVRDSLPLETLADFTFDFSDRSHDFKAAVDSLSPGLLPRSFFVHSMLPHTPWTYLPSGKQYLPWKGADSKGAVDGKKWLNDQWIVTQDYQRHLLQVGFVDKLLGALMSRLKQIDAFDRSLIVVTADHGSSFRPDDLFRGVSETNYADIMAIPLLIKAPFQTEGLVSDRNVETVDILPTVAEILGIQVPWKIDGRSALGPETEERLEKTVFRSLDREFTFDDILLSRQESLERKLELFGSGPWRGVFAAGSHGDLVGKRIDQNPVDEQTVGEVRIKGDVFYENVDLDSPFVFPIIEGRLWFGFDARLPAQLAIGINGVIHATTQTSPLFGDGSGFSALVPETSFRSGENRVEVFLVVENEGGPRLKRLALESHARYRVDTSPDGMMKTLVATDGESIPVHGTGGLGWVVGGTNLEESGTFIQGWAVDIEESRSVRSILVFKNGELLYSDSPGLFEPIVTEILGDSSPAMAGFYFELPTSQFPDLEGTNVEVFAVSNENVAFEVNHPPKKGGGWPFASGIANGGATPYPWGSTIHFGQAGTSSWFRTSGWSYAEEEFTWTDGVHAWLVFQVARPGQPVLLEATLNAFLASDKIEEQRINILVNGKEAGVWRISSAGFHDETLFLEPSLFNSTGPTIITFETPDAVSPSDVGLGPDRRMLGAAFQALRLSLVAPSDPNGNGGQ